MKKYFVGIYEAFPMDEELFDTPEEAVEFFKTKRRIIKVGATYRVFVVTLAEHSKVKL